MQRSAQRRSVVCCRMCRLNDPPLQLQPTSCLGRYIDVWGPVCRGQNPPMEHILGGTGVAAAVMQVEKVAGGSSSDLPGRSVDKRHLYRCSSSNQGSYGSLTGAAAAAAAELAAFEKGLKQRVMLAVDHFNKDYKKGFQFLQVSCPASTCQCSQSLKKVECAVNMGKWFCPKSHRCT